MDPEQWNRAKDIFAAALERDLGEWDAFLREACGADDALRVELESLLSAYNTSDGLSNPPWHALPRAATAVDGVSIGPYR
jgi:hypothetical protein